MKLFKKVTIYRPDSCDDCPFAAEDSDNGPLCCGHRRATYGEITDKGQFREHIVHTPEEALKNGCECMFVKDEV